MSASTSPPATQEGRRPRRVQRFVVGMAMSVIVFFLERVVLRAIKRGATKAT